MTDIIADITAGIATPQTIASYFRNNQHLLEYIWPNLSSGLTFTQRVELFSLAPQDMQVATIRYALAKHLKNTLIPHIKNYKLHYELTITLPSGGLFSQLQTLVGKVINSKMLDASRAYYTYELTESGTPHVHMLIRPTEGKTIQASRIKKLIPNNRFSFAKVRDLKHYCEYLIKDLEKEEHTQFKEFHNPPPSDYAESQTTDI